MRWNWQRQRRTSVKVEPIIPQPNPTQPNSTDRARRGWIANVDSRKQQRRRIRQRKEWILRYLTQSIEMICDKAQNIFSYLMDSPICASIVLRILWIGYLRSWSILRYWNRPISKGLLNIQRYILLNAVFMTIYLEVHSKVLTISQQSDAAATSHI